MTKRKLKAPLQYPILEPVNARRHGYINEAIAHTKTKPVTSLNGLNERMLNAHESIVNTEMFMTAKTTLILLNIHLL
jgi:hypothetical protein